MSVAQPITLRAKDATNFAFSVPNISDDQADTAAKLLTKNHEGHHIFFNDQVHALITLLGLGASPAELQKMYDENTSYQRPLGPVDEVIAKKFSNLDKFNAGLGDGSNYSSYLSFFTSELQSDGIAKVLDKYLFAQTPLADDMLSRLFASIVHPLIHLGFAIETNSIPLVAEALAETAVHPNSLKPFFLEAEKAASKTSRTQTLFELIKAAQADKSLVEHASKEGYNICAEFTTAEALPSVVAIASQYRISPSSNAPLNSIQSAIAEQHSTLAYAVTATQDPNKKLKLDFLFIHALNVSIFLPVFLASPHIPEAAAHRLAEWNARNSMLLYAHIRCPELHPEMVRQYEPKPEHGDWNAIFRRACEMSDDGHLQKVIRALAAGEKYCKSYEGEEWLLVRGDEWRRMAALTLESMRTSGAEPKWVFAAGDEEAWKDVPSKL